MNTDQKEIITKYGQNKSVQYFVRRGLDDQAKFNRKILMMKPNSAAVNMRDNREVFDYLINNQDAPFVTRPMHIQ